MLDFGSTEAFEVVYNLLVDDGVPSRFHRKALCAEGLYRYIGIGFASHDKHETVCVLILS
jgi:hypothetical protein